MPMYSMTTMPGQGGSTRVGNVSGTGDPSLEEARRRIQALTEGRAGELANDPYQKSVMDFLQGVTGGQNVPFTNEVQGALLAQQGRGSADAEAAQMASLRESMGASGGSIYDPAYQSAAREAMSQRQGRNLDAAGQMAATAGRENFQARMQGAGQLANARNAQNAQVNQLGLAGAGYRAMESREVGGGGGGGYAGGGYAPRPASNTQPFAGASNQIQNQPGYITPGSVVRGGGAPAGGVAGYGAPTAPAAAVTGAPRAPETRDAYMTNAERNAAQRPRLADMTNQTGFWNPTYKPRQ